MSGIINTGGGGGTTDGDIVFLTYSGEILFKTTAGEVLRMRLPNGGSPSVEISGNLNLTAGNQYTINGVPIGGSGATFVDHEVPGGLVDGSNVNFTLANTPISGSLYLFENGQLLYGGGQDYTLTGTSIVFVVAPTGKLTASYRI